MCKTDRDLSSHRDERRGVFEAQEEVGLDGATLGHGGELGGKRKKQGVEYVEEGVGAHKRGRRRKHGQADNCGREQVSYKKMDGKEDMNPLRSSKETGGSPSGSSEPTAIFELSKSGCLQPRAFPDTGRSPVSESSRQGVVPLEPRAAPAK